MKVSSTPSQLLLQGYALCRDMPATTPYTTERPLDDMYSIYPAYKIVLQDPPSKHFEVLQKLSFRKSIHKFFPKDKAI